MKASKAAGGGEDWRSQVKQKVEEHAQRKRKSGLPLPSTSLADDPEPTSKPPTKRAAKDREPPQALQAEDTAYERPLVPIPAIEDDQTRPSIITFTDKAIAAPPPVARPIRPVDRQAAPVVTIEEPRMASSKTEAALPAARVEAVSGAGIKDPGVPRAAAEIDPATENPDDEFGPEQPVSLEYFISRILAGLVDLLAPTGVGVLAVYICAQLFHFDFWTSSSARIAVVLSSIIYLYSSIFALSSTGQTLGMHVGGVRLLYADSETLPFRSILIRVLAFPAVVATLFGLLWALSDPWGRTLHDLLSKTRVVASRPETRPSHLGML